MLWIYALANETVCVDGFRVCSMIKNYFIKRRLINAFHKSSFVNHLCSPIRQISLLHVIGIMLNLSDFILGLTILAFGNSIGGNFNYKLLFYYVPV